MNSFIKICLIIFVLPAFLYNANAQENIIPDFLIKPTAGLNGGSVTVTDIARANDGSIYETGRFTNTADFNTGPDTFNLSGGSVFVAKYDAANNFAFAFNLICANLMGINSIAADKSGNVYITGYYSATVDFDPGPGKAELSAADFYDFDIFFAKYDASGNFIFVKRIGGLAEQMANSITLDNDLNIYIAGYFQGDKVDFDPGPGVIILPQSRKKDIFFAKYDNNGNYLFAKPVSGIDDEDAAGLAVDKDKNILITGYFKSGITDFDPGTGTVYLHINGTADIYFAKYDSLGNYVFAYSIGGKGADYGNDITTDAAGNIFITGQFWGVSGYYADFDPAPGAMHQAYRVSNGYYDIYVAKYTPDGSYIFANTTGSITDDAGRKLQTDAAGNVYVTGTFSGRAVDFNTGDTLSASGGNDIFFAKYDGTGNYIYTRQVSGLKDENAAAILVYENGKVLLAGSFVDSVIIDAVSGKKVFSKGLENSFLAAYNAGGNFTAVNCPGVYRSFKLETTVSRIAHDKERNIYVTGQFEGIMDFDPGPGTWYLTSSSDAGKLSNSSYSDDIFFAKYAADGKLIFAKNISGPYGEYPSSIALDDENNIYLCGYFQDSTDFDPGSGKYILSPDSGFDDAKFFAKYDAGGNLLFVKKIQMSNYSSSMVNGIALDKNKNIYIAGYFYSADFDPGPGIVEKHSAGGIDIFLAKYDPLGNYVYCNQIGQTLNYQGCSDLVISENNKLIITGRLQGDAVDFDPGPGTWLLSAFKNISHYVAGYSTDGNLLFASSSRAYKNASSLPVKLAHDNAGNIYVCGEFSGKIDFDPGPDSLIVNTKTSNTDIFFQKYDANGAYLFTKTLSSKTDGYANNIANAIYADDYGSIYITGVFSSKTDFDPGPDTFYLSQKNKNYNYGDIFLAKYDSSGNYIYAYPFTSINTVADNHYLKGNFGKDLYVNNYGEIILSGESSGNLNLATGSGIYLLKPSYSGYNFFIMQYQQPGVCAIADSLYAADVTASASIVNWRYPYTSQGFKILYRPNGSNTWSSVNAAGYSLSKKLIGLLPGTLYEWKIIALCSTDTSGYSGKSYFKTKAAAASAAEENINENEMFTVYPNPSGGKFNVTVKGKINVKAIQVKDLNGNIIYQNFPAWQQNVFSIDISNVLTGTYIVAVFDGVKYNNKKIIIER